MGLSLPPWGQATPRKKGDSPLSSRAVGPILIVSSESGSP